jgi:hypothetical protein
MWLNVIANLKLVHIYYRHGVRFVLKTMGELYMFRQMKEDGMSIRSIAKKY